VRARTAGYLTAATLLAVLACAPLAQAHFVATAEDPAGDSTDPNPARDLTAAGLSYDRRSGSLFGAIRLAGAPAEETDATLALFAGVRVASGCNGIPAAGFGGGTSEFGARWLRIDEPSGNGPRGDAEKRGGLTELQRFTVTERQLAGQPVDCVIATLSEPGNAANIYDTVGPLELVGQPALALKIGGVPRKFAPGRARRIKLKLSNPGDAPTGPVRLSLGRARGLTVKAKRKLKSIAPGGRTTVRATVTLAGRASTITDLKATAKAGELRVRAEAELVVRRPSSGGGGGGSSGGGVCNRYIGFPDGTSSLILVPC
jgi:hypothetical protein